MPEPTRPADHTQIPGPLLASRPTKPQAWHLAWLTDPPDRGSLPLRFVARHQTSPLGTLKCLLQPLSSLLGRMGVAIAEIGRDDDALGRWAVGGEPVD
jgi:hypothetical protein